MRAHSRGFVARYVLHASVIARTFACAVIASLVALLIVPERRTIFLRARLIFGDACFSCRATLGSVTQNAIVCHALSKWLLLHVVSMCFKQLRWLVAPGRRKIFLRAKNMVMAGHLLIIQRDPPKPLQWRVIYMHK